MAKRTLLCGFTGGRYFTWLAPSSSHMKTGKHGGCLIIFSKSPSSSLSRMPWLSEQPKCVEYNILSFVLNDIRSTLVNDQSRIDAGPLLPRSRNLTRWNYRCGCSLALSRTMLNDPMDASIRVIQLHLSLHGTWAIQLSAWLSAVTRDSLQRTTSRPLAASQNIGTVVEPIAINLQVSSWPGTSREQQTGGIRIGWFPSMVFRSPEVRGTLVGKILHTENSLSVT